MPDKIAPCPGWETKARLTEDDVPPDLLAALVDELYGFDTQTQAAEPVALRIISLVASRISPIFGPQELP